jgi:hypothetical protein
MWVQAFQVVLVVVVVVAGTGAGEELDPIARGGHFRTEVVQSSAELIDTIYQQTLEGIGRRFDSRSRQLMEPVKMGHCEFEDDLCGWTNMPSRSPNHFNWTRADKSQGDNGPERGAGDDDTSNYFAYIETTDRKEGDSAVLTSKGTGCSLHLKYYMNGAAIGSLTVSSIFKPTAAEALAETNPALWTEEQRWEGSTGGRWQVVKVVPKFPGYTKSTARFWRINATHGGTDGSVLSTPGSQDDGDIAIDDLIMQECLPDKPDAWTGYICLMILFGCMTLILIKLMKPAWSKPNKEAQD